MLMWLTEIEEDAEDKNRRTLVLNTEKIVKMEEIPEAKRIGEDSTEITYQLTPNEQEVIRVENDLSSVRVTYVNMI